MTRLRPLLIAGLVSTLTLTGLGGSPARASSRDRILTGAVVDQDGHAVPGASVAFEDDAALSGFLILACFIPPIALVPGLCFADVATATTDSNGHYRLVLKAGSELSKPGIRHLFVKGKASGAGPMRPGFTGDLALSSSTRSLPPVSLLTRPIRVTQESGRTRFNLTRPQGATGLASVSLRADDNKSLAFTLPSAKDDPTADNHVLEDGTRSFDATVVGAWAGKPASWGSASQGLPTVGKPASRGLACSTYVVGGARVPYRSSCPFTDGHLGTELGLLKALELERGLGACHFTSQCTTPNEIEIDLGALRRLDAVVWRGCWDCAEHPVQLSLEGGTWIDWPQQHHEGDRDAVVTGAPTVTRYIRVQGGGFLTWYLREVSVWAPPLLPLP